MAKRWRWTGVILLRSINGLRGWPATRQSSAARHSGDRARHAPAERKTCGTPGNTASRGSARRTKGRHRPSPLAANERRGVQVGELQAAGADDRPSGGRPGNTTDETNVLAAATDRTAHTQP